MRIANTLRVTLIAVALAAPACKPAMLRMDNGPQVPAAQGTVQMAMGDNGNTRLKIVVRHLASPEKVTPGATTFAVWARADAPGSEPQNLGTLIVDKDLEGRLETVTPLRNFELFITPEQSATAQAPSGGPVLSTKIGPR